MEATDFEIGLTLRLGPSPKSARLARTTFRQALQQMLDGSELECVQLLISELVTNSYRHAGLGPEDRIDLFIQVDKERIRVEVTDPGRGFQKLPPPSEDLRASGWGLYLVDQMADVSGVINNPTTTVWFEMFRSPQARSRTGSETQLTVRSPHTAVHHNRQT